MHSYEDRSQALVEGGVRRKVDAQRAARADRDLLLRHLLLCHQYTIGEGRGFIGTPVIPIQSVFCTFYIPKTVWVHGCWISKHPALNVSFTVYQYGGLD